MTLRRLSPILFAAFLALGACNKSEGGKDKLPPATGEGAKPLPEIPALATIDGGAGDQAAPGDTRTTGTLEAKDQVTVAAKGGGTIVDMKVDEGSRVKKGQVLFRTDSRDAQLMKRAGETQLRAARLALKTAETEYKRIAGLAAQNAAPRQQVDQLEAQVEGAKVQIAAAQDALAMANKAIADATVKAPIDGVVVKKLLNVGEHASTMPPSPVLVLQDQSSLELKFRLPERALASIEKGDRITVAIPSLEASRPATVALVSPSVDPRTRTVELTAVLDNADGALRPGMMAEVTLGEAPEPAKAAAPAAPTPAK